MSIEIGLGYLSDLPSGPVGGEGVSVLEAMGRAGRAVMSNEDCWICRRCKAGGFRDWDRREWGCRGL